MASVTAQDLWRARVGRLPRADAPRLTLLVKRFGFARVSRSISATAAAELRRTADRWAFFLALFGEAP